MKASQVSVNGCDGLMDCAASKLLTCGAFGCGYAGRLTVTCWFEAVA